MTQEEKQLLLVDLCGKLPYGVNVKCPSDDEPYTLLSINWNKEIVVIGFEMDRMYVTSKQKLVDIKPYLRPMSSMTDEEKNELKEYLDAEEVDCNGFGYSEGGTLEDYVSSTPYSICSDVVDWLNKKMFDYRGLIPLGSALEAPEGMYNT